MSLCVKNVVNVFATSRNFVYIFFILKREREREPLGIDQNKLTKLKLIFNSFEKQQNQNRCFLPRFLKQRSVSKYLLVTKRERNKHKQKMEISRENINCIRKKGFSFLFFALLFFAFNRGVYPRTS